MWAVGWVSHHRVGVWKNIQEYGRSDVVLLLMEMAVVVVMLCWSWRSRTVLCSTSGSDAVLAMALLAEVVVSMVLVMQKWYLQPHWWGQDDGAGVGCTVLYKVGVC